VVGRRDVEDRVLVVDRERVLVAAARRPFLAVVVPARRPPPRLADGRAVALPFRLWRALVAVAARPPVPVCVEVRRELPLLVGRVRVVRVVDGTGAPSLDRLAPSDPVGWFTSAASAARDAPSVRRSRVRIPAG
jgi:hypothetical protein